MGKKKSKANADFKAKLKENADAASKIKSEKLQDLIAMIPKGKDGAEDRRYRRMVKKVTETGKLPKGLRKQLEKSG
jgi:hypothetical protein